MTIELTIEPIAMIVFFVFILVWLWAVSRGPYSERARCEYMKNQITRCDKIAEANESKRKEKLKT